MNYDYDIDFHDIMLKRLGTARATIVCIVGIVPVSTYCHGTGRVPSIYFRLTHHQKRESGGKFNLFIAAASNTPSSQSFLFRV